MSGPRRTSRRRLNVQINESTLMPEIREQLEQLRGHVIKIGMQGNAELAMIAGVLEFGSLKMGIPSRPFIRGGQKKATAAITRLLKTRVTDLVFGDATAQNLLEEVGTLGHQKMLLNFQKIKQPPLTPIYARRKGNKKVLIDQKNLEESLTFEIVRKG